MARAVRILTPLVALTLAAGLAFADKDKDKDDPTETKGLDGTLYKGLRDVINRGVDLYRNDDPAGCYRLYEGSLMTMKPLLDHRPELQKLIDKDLAGARRDPVMWRRAYTLRSTLDKVRADLNPKKDLLHKPKVEEEKKSDKQKEKPKEEKKDDKKKDEQEGKTDC